MGSKNHNFFEMSSQVTISTQGKKKRSSSFVKKSGSSRSKKISSKRSTGALVLFRGPKRNAILPERYTCPIVTTMMAYIAVGDISPTAGNYMNFSPNTLVQPFNQTYIINTAVNTYSFHGSYVQGYSASTPACGLATLGSLYEQYKVHKYTIECCVQPQTGSDTVSACLVPLGTQQIPNSIAANVNMAVMSGQPGAIAKVCSSGVSSIYNRLVLSRSVYEDLGYTKSQYEDEASTDINTDPNANNKVFCGLFMQILDGSTNADRIVVTWKLVQYVTFSNLASQLV